MYNDNEINKLIQPIIDRQIEINTFVIGKIAQRIKRIGELLPSDAYKLEQLAKTSADIREINQRLAALTKLQLSDIKKVIRIVADNIYKAAKPFFDYRQRIYLPFNENEQVQRAVKAIETQTSGTYKNMAKSQAFMVRDPKHPTVLKPTTIARTYQNTVDKAIQTVQSGVQDYQTTMRETLKEITDSGIVSVEYNTETGKRYTQRLDTAVRRNLLDGVAQVSQAVQNEVGKQFGADGVEITVHNCPAPDHQYVQGHQFTMSEYAKIAPVTSIQKDSKVNSSAYDFEDGDVVYDIQGRAYARFKRRLTTCNCMHFAFNIVIGQAPQNYSDKELKQILKNNEKGVDIDGKHYTKYQATQVQRRMETNIRKLKDAQMAAKEAGDIEGAKKYQKKVTELTKEYKAFSAQAGFTPKLERIRVAGYKRI